jgi:hypothetical protein
VDKPGPTQDFYRWEDAQGRVHIVSSLDEVPAAERAKMAHVELNSSDAVARYPSPSSWSFPQIEWPSFAIGFGAALLVAMVFRLMPNAWRWLWKLALVGGIGFLLTGAYLGAVRRSAGLEGGGALASPSALIQDAKSAVEQMNQRQKEQAKELQEIQGTR